MIGLMGTTRRLFSRRLVDCNLFGFQPLIWSFCVVHFDVGFG